jgi:mannose-6-phosphate isomerase-like protein (cupin superfamily)
LPQGPKHRVANRGTESLVLIEIQTGTYFGEGWQYALYADDYDRQSPEREAQRVNRQI